MIGPAMDADAGTGLRKAAAANTPPTSDILPSMVILLEVPALMHNLSSAV